MANHDSRRSFIGGSDARIIMGNDEAALVRLWREKRGEVEPVDLSGNLIVQLGVVTEPLNRHWFEEWITGQTVKEVRRRISRPGSMGTALFNPAESMGAVGDEDIALLRLWRKKMVELLSPWRPRLSKPKAFPSPVFVDEFDPGCLNCSLQLRTRFVRNPRAKSAFKSLDGRKGQPSALGKL
jgi:hypothetical protein